MNAMHAGYRIGTKCQGVTERTRCVLKEDIEIEKSGLPRASDDWIPGMIRSDWNFDASEMRISAANMFTFCG
jgi:hypothetical protein